MYMHMGTTGASNEPAVPKTFVGFVYMRVHKNATMLYCTFLCTTVGFALNESRPSGAAED